MDFTLNQSVWKCRKEWGSYLFENGTRPSFGSSYAPADGDWIVAWVHVRLRKAHRRHGTHSLPVPFSMLVVVLELHISVEESSMF